MLTYCHLHSLILSRTRPSLFLPGIMVIWGTLTCVMGVVKDFKHLVVLRTLIGMNVVTIQSSALIKRPYTDRNRLR